MKIDAIRRPSDCASFWNEWETLHNSTWPLTPFSSPSWNLTWWKHYSNTSIGVKYKFFLHTVRDDGGALQAVVPWMIATRPAIGPFKVHMLNFFGADQSLTEVRGIICRPDSETAVIIALREYLNDSDIRLDVFEWCHIKRLESLELLEAEGPLAFSQITYMYLLDLRESWETIYGKLSAYTRRNMRRAEEKLSTLNKPVHVNVISSKNELAEGIERFLSLHASRAKTSDMFAHPDKFKSKVNREFIYEIFETCFEKNTAFIFEIRVAGDVAACRTGFAIGSTLYIYYSGYDPKWRDYNVGSVLMMEIIKWAIKNGFTELNLSAGRDRSKLQWRPLEFVFQSGLHVRSDFRGSVICRAYEAVRKIRNRRLATARQNLGLVESVCR